MGPRAEVQYTYHTRREQGETKIISFHPRPEQSRPDDQPLEKSEPEPAEGDPEIGRPGDLPG